MFSQISLLANPKIPNADAIEAEIVSIIRGHGKQIACTPSESDLMVTIGGDGTVLKGFRTLGDADIPLLGLNFGKFGFLTIDCLDKKKVFSDLFDGKFKISPRLFLEVWMKTNDETKLIGRALNEVVAFRKDIRILKLEITFNSTSFYFKTDGIIISTPTGSTAHAFSAGGPVVSPETSAFVIVAVAPFTATWRNCMFGGEEVLLRVTRGCEIVLDGQVTAQLVQGQTLIIRKSVRPFRLLVPETWDFWKTLKEKFSWGKSLS